MEQIILEFSDIISKYEIFTNNTDYNKFIFDANIILKDNSILACKDVLIFFDDKPEKRKYSFHWMDINNNLLIRWDNANHHKNLETYPFHKHIGNINKIEVSNEISLFEVLTFIRKKLKQ